MRSSHNNLNKESVTISIFNEEDSWDIFWKWKWFTKELWISQLWEEEKLALEPVFSLLTKYQVKSILDCSSGLGFKTVLFAKNGYNVEGSDASAIAIKYAPELANEEDVNINFFISLYRDLDKKCKRKYDCVYSDNFDELKTRQVLQESAEGIYSVLKKGGKFIFCGVPPEWSKKDLKQLIEKEWLKRQKIEIIPPYKKDGVRVICLEATEKTTDGILGKCIFLIEEKGVMRAEIAFIMDVRIKWTFQEYMFVLKKAGFRKVECIKKKSQIYIISTK